MNLEFGHNFMTQNWSYNFMSHINFKNYETLGLLKHICDSW